MGYAPQEAALLARYVSNLDRDVYAISGLPEEVVAVVFARVSRSPASFRDNLLALIKDRELALVPTEPVDPAQADPGAGDPRFDVEKARRFHERVVLGYGHSSVAELAVAHVGVERISRLASARLELANPFLSFIEYSQRYQRPARGAYVVPPEVAEDPHLRDEYERVQAISYGAYEELLEGLVEHFRRALHRAPDESDRAFASRVEKAAFEDARYALTLAVHTNLGLTGNGRALRDAIVRLLSDPYPECRRLAEAIRDEVSTVLPVLLRHANPSDYQLLTRSVFEGKVAGLVPAPGEGVAKAPGDPDPVVLLDWTGRAGAGPSGDEGATATAQKGSGVAAGSPVAGPAEAVPDGEIRALRTLLEGALLMHTRLRGRALRQYLEELPPGRLVELVQALIQHLGPHDHPHDAFHRVAYEAEFCVSEACWHQLLRHSRKVDFAPAEPGPEDGWVTPPSVEEAGLRPVLERAVGAAEELYARLQREAPQAAPYVLTGAHRRRTRARMDLWELYHLVNLRGGSEAQWEIRHAVLSLAEQVRQVHPHLAPMRRRT